MTSAECLPLDAPFRCRVAGAALLRGSAPTIAQQRRQPLSIGAEKLPLSFLKHADDQTVLAVSAVLEVIAANGWCERSYADWGVVAAPSFFGRVGIAKAIERLQQEGAWGVSPHLIPHLSLHAMSGTVSQALKMHGPNFGVGGGPNAAPDGFLLAAGMLAGGQLPGLWLILTGYESECIPARNEIAAAPPCLAAAFALTADQNGAGGVCLSLVLIDGRPDWQSGPSLPAFHLSQVAQTWTPGAALPGGRWRLADGFCLHIDAPVLASEAAA